MAGRSKPVIAVFDFDETLIVKDSLFDFLYYSYPLSVFIFKTMRCTPMLVLFALKRISNDAAKERLLTVFLGGASEDQFRALCEAYKDRLDNLANEDALKCVDRHHKQGDEVVIVSASPEDWIAPWAKSHDISNVIATKLSTRKGQLTGRLATPNCHGPEKVTRFLQVFPDRNNYILYAYGDGKSDKQMFELADFAFEKRFE